MEAYFDNSATTRCSKGVCDVMMKVFLEDYGNPSSLHLKGLEAEQRIRTAREQIARTLRVEPKELIFTSGGTESDNLALMGTAMANKRRGRHLITTKIEHAAVLRTMQHLEEEGFEVTYLSVDKEGRIDMGELRDAIRPDTILVSIMYVNNEIGTIEPIEEASRIIKEANPNTLFHVDAIQAYGKLRIFPQRLGIDLMSVSGHKIHGPKGVGFLYVKEKTKISPILFGGGHQHGMRSGTENVPGIAGLGQAALESYTDFEEKAAHLASLRDALTEGLAECEWAHVNGPTEDRSYAAPHIVSVSFDRVRSEVLLHALEEKGIFVSAGSACSSNKPAISETLKNIGVKKEYLDSTIRFSFSVENTKEEVAYALSVLKDLVPMLSRFTRH